MNALQKLHTFGLDAHANAVRVIEDDAQLHAFARHAGSAPFWLLGEGSNTVFVEDFEGTVVRIATRGITVEETHDAYCLTVAAGENWHSLVEWTLSNGIFGLENLALIPGSVGATPIQNIGAYGVEIARFIDAVIWRAFDSAEVHRLSAQECAFGYRDSIFKTELADKGIIEQVELKLPKQWQPQQAYAELAALNDPTARDIFDTVVEVRQRKLPDPARLGNAGSFFKNPVITREHYLHLQQQWPAMPHYPVDETRVKVPAAWLIDTLGFKGKGCGGVRCHINQPLVLVNEGQGTGEQVLTLARAIRDQVQDNFAITLENEVRLVGKQGLIVL
ncbi:UDP-N-acetylmuramate dehydrogenase [Aestuariibacter halophilus]|uniref:UDP-N-acetylenolpyruvoylglucosamine reductase n=1 Tax=Fluctibacter halophilus TaxID=226011 RepID=A0ABS8GCS4_9ALTE|nr:UDP-N-acetylmuramate dehydrogenase [Aestuariibacter halophilus]MCC2618327.1 UDP-N-acetylmuramate dehydrogenase [Aestuariibacter halophilus]